MDGFGRRAWRRCRALHRGQKAVSAPGHGLHEPGIGGRVPERLAQLVDGSIQAVVEIDERVLRPEFLAQFLARDDVSGPLQEKTQNLEWLFLKADAGAVLAQFPRHEIHFKDPKTDGPPGLVRLRYGHTSMLPRSVAPGGATIALCRPPVQPASSVPYRPSGGPGPVSSAWRSPE
jgi:hypothetical protein